MIDSGYRDLTCRIRHMLSESPISDLRSVQVETDGNRILIHGRVRTFYAKQMAQETVRRASKEVLIVNSLNVD
ncbi:MAG TPA: transport-associated domain protein [Planctomycetaceae bacterium]|nr:transport-associated domain protein [Planctomycetaceae bacterium]